VLCCYSRPPHAVAKSEWRQLWGQGFQSTTSSTKLHNGALPSSKDSRTSCYSIVRELPRQNRTQCTPEAETADQPTQKADQPFVEASPSFRNCRPLGGMENELNLRSGPAACSTPTYLPRAYIKSTTRNAQRPILFVNGLESWMHADQKKA
jgi:hypothetical protein